MNKRLNRDEGKYDHSLTSGWKTGREGHAIHDYLRTRFPGFDWTDKTGAFRRVIKALSDAKPGNGVRGVHVADMCGGLGIAVREIEAGVRSQYPELRLTTSLADLTDWRGVLSSAAPDSTLGRYWREQLKRRPDFWDPARQPQLIIRDATHATLSAPADLILIHDGFQYLTDKLQTLVNWYNQLEQNGMMFLLTNWRPHGMFLRYRDSRERTTTLFESLVRTLQEQGIPVLGEKGCYTASTAEDRWAKVLISRKPGTQLELSCTYLESPENRQTGGEFFGDTMCVYRANPGAQHPVKVVDIARRLDD